MISLRATNIQTVIISKRFLESKTMAAIFYIKTCSGNGVVFEMTILLSSKKAIDETKHAPLKVHSYMQAILYV